MWIVVVCFFFQAEGGKGDGEGGLGFRLVLFRPPGGGSFWGGSLVLKKKKTKKKKTKKKKKKNQTIHYKYVYPTVHESTKCHTSNSLDQFPQNDYRPTCICLAEVPFDMKLAVFCSIQFTMELRKIATSSFHCA